MPNEFIIKNGYISQGNSQITGSLIVTTGITGSLLGTSSLATSASFLTTLQSELNDAIIFNMFI